MVECLVSVGNCAIAFVHCCWVLIWVLIWWWRAATSSIFYNIMCKKNCVNFKRGHFQCSVRRWKIKLTTVVSALQCSSYAYFWGRCALPVLACALPDLHAPCPNWKKKKKLKKKKKKTIIYFLFLQNVIAVFVFLDSRCKNYCKMLADLCPCFHQLPTRPNFGRSRIKDFVSFAH